MHPACYWPKCDLCAWTLHIQNCTQFQEQRSMGYQQLPNALRQDSNRQYIGRMRMSKYYISQLKNCFVYLHCTSWGSYSSNYLMYLMRVYYKAKITGYSGEISSYRVKLAISFIVCIRNVISSAISASPHSPAVSFSFQLTAYVPFWSTNTCLKDSFL